MRILHSADWHLGARLGRLSRSDDLQRAIDQVIGYCEQESVDVLLIAGDLFHHGAWSEEIRDGIDYLRYRAEAFLHRGGTIVTVTGNHDQEVFCATLRSALELVEPRPTKVGDRWPTGRFHLINRPSACRLGNQRGEELQFVLMPYPTPARYLDGQKTRYSGPSEKNRILMNAFGETVRKLRNHPRLDTEIATVLVGHVHLNGAVLPGGRTSGEEDDILIPTNKLGSEWSYVALGHIHKPQAIAGRDHIRYSGSIDRIRADEAHERNGVVLLEIDAQGSLRAPLFLPIDSTPILDLEVSDLESELAKFERAYEQVRHRALVRARIAYRESTDDLDTMIRKFRSLFPRCYDLRAIDRDRQLVGSNGKGIIAPSDSFRETVLQYLSKRLEGHELGEMVLGNARNLLDQEDP